MYYFAYGSNMSFKQMRKRCPGNQFVGRAKLFGYKFVYDGHSSARSGAVANIIKSDKVTVWGALFEVNDECIKNLDRYEGYPTSYQRESMVVEDEQGSKYEALIYLREPREEGAPSNEYRAILLEGARDCGLPEEYINGFIRA